MAEQVLMIALSPTMETGTLVKWSKKEGDKVTSGDVLCEVETDKAAMDYESISEGTLLKILVHEGQGATVGEVIAIIGEEGEDISDLLPGAGGDSSPSGVTSRDDSPAKIDGDSPHDMHSDGDGSPTAAGGDSPITSTTDSRIKVSPLAKRIAEMSEIPLNKIAGSGPEGRIVKADIEKYIANLSNMTAQEDQSQQKIDQAASLPTAQASSHSLIQPAASSTLRPGLTQPSSGQLNKTASIVYGSAVFIPPLFI